MEETEEGGWFGGERWCGSIYCGRVRYRVVEKGRV